MASAEQSGNPFRSEIEGDTTDRDLVAAAVEGDQEALESLIVRHQPWCW